MKSSKAAHNKKLRRDLLLILVSTLIAIVVARTGLLSHIRQFTNGVGSLDSFISGVFFTSLFTTPLSIVAFADIAKGMDIFQMALWGACGAVIGDSILFLFIKDNLADDVSYLLRAPKYKKILHIFRRGLFRWITPFVGALIIASPLPDELGIAMMGFSKIKTPILIPLSFIMNFIGILLIGLAVHAFVF